MEDGSDAFARKHLAARTHRVSVQTAQQREVGEADAMHRVL